MKIIKKFLSIIVAAITAIYCSVPVFADSQHYDTVIYDTNYIYQTNISYDDGSILAFESKNGGLYGEFTHKRYDFSINYIIQHNDGIITSEWFGLSDEYTIEQTAYDDETETYTVKVETQEELDKLYEASAELLEKGTVENVYKQFTYRYACFQEPGYAYITLNEADKSFNPNSIAGLENIAFQQDEKNSKVYYCDYTLENHITLKNAEETIRATENVENFRTEIYICLVAHTPKTIKIYANEYERAILKGDANDDTVLNARDCAYIAKMIANGTPEEISDSADFNEDGKVNVRDASALAAHLISLYKNPIDNPTI